MKRSAESLTTQGSIRKELQDWLRFFRGEAHILRELPALFFQQAANQPDSTAPSGAARSRFERGLETRFWLRWVNKAARRDPCLSTLAGHTGKITSCQFSPDGTRVISSSSDGTLRVWDANAGRELMTLVGSGGGPIDASSDEPADFLLESLQELEAEYAGVQDCALAADGRRILSAHQDGSLRTWDLATGNEFAVFGGHGSSVTRCAISPDGRQILSGGTDGRLKIWDANDGRLLRVIVTSDDEDKSWAYRDEPVGCGFSPDGTQLISISRKGEFKLWDAATGSRVAAFGGSDWSDHKKEVCTFSSDGSHVLWRDQVWDVATGQKLPALLDHGYWYVAMMKRDGENSDNLVPHDNKGRPVSVNVSRYSPDGKWIATGAEDGTLKIWDAQTLTETRSVTAHLFPITACSFSPDGLRVATGSTDNTIRIWDLTVEDDSSAPRAHESRITACAFSPDGGRLVTASIDRTLKLWDVSTWREIACLTGHAGAVNDCQFSPDGTLIASASSDHTLNIWDGFGGDLVATLQGHTKAVNACSFSPSGEQLVSCGDDWKLKVWDVRTGGLITSLSGEIGELTDCSYSPDGSLIAFGSRDSFPGLFRAPARTFRGKLAGKFRGHVKEVTACKVSPDNARIASSSLDGTVRFWTGVESSSASSKNLGGVHDFAFAPDGSLLATASGDGIVRVLHSGTAMEFWQASIEGSNRSVAWSPDGSLIAVGTRSGTLEVLRVENSVLGPPVLTAVVNRDGGYNVLCPYCRGRVEVSYEDLGNESSCPRCSANLMLNAFTTSLGELAD